MTLRDWLAGMALSSQLSYSRAENIAREAYKIADAMIKERNKKEEK